MTLGTVIIYFFSLIGAVFFCSVVFKIIFDRHIEPSKGEDDEWIDSEP